MAVSNYIAFGKDEQFSFIYSDLNTIQNLLNSVVCFFEWHQKKIYNFKLLQTTLTRILYLKSVIKL